MDNYTIADKLSLLSKLMDIHGENEFKSKSYASAAFTLEKLDEKYGECESDVIDARSVLGARTSLRRISTKAWTPAEETPWDSGELRGRGAAARRSWPRTS